MKMERNRLRNTMMPIMLLVSMVLSGCRVEGKLVLPYEMTKEISDVMYHTPEDGLYMISGEEKQYVLFQDMGKGVTSMGYSVEDHVLTIQLETQVQNEPETAVYKIPVDPSFDSIQVRVDGQREAFEIVFLN